MSSNTSLTDAIGDAVHDAIVAGGGKVLPSEAVKAVAEKLGIPVDHVAGLWAGSTLARIRRREQEATHAQE